MERTHDELLLPSAAARMLNCSAAAIRLWARRGKLPSVPLSGGWRAFRREDLDHFAATRAGEAAAPIGRGDD